MGKRSRPAEVQESAPEAQDFVHLAADAITAAAETVGALAQQAADAMSPYALQARERITPFTQQAVGRVSCTPSMPPGSRAEGWPRTRSR